MIFDRIENIDKYGLKLQFIIDDLSKNEVVQGKFNIDEPQCFGIGLEYETKDEEKNLWEAHRRHIDIHIILEGEEWVNVSDQFYMKATNEYQDDYQLFEGEREHRFHLKPGYFLLLFPHEVHKTGIQIEDGLSVKKRVYKYLIDG